MRRLATVSLVLAIFVADGARPSGGAEVKANGRRVLQSANPEHRPVTEAPQDVGDYCASEAGLANSGEKWRARQDLNLRHPRLRRTVRYPTELRAGTPQRYQR